MYRNLSPVSFEVRVLRILLCSFYHTSPHSMCEGTNRDSPTVAFVSVLL